MSGEVRLQSTRADDPYGYPYTLDLECTDAASPCAVTGALRADGIVSATLVIGPVGPGQAETQHELSRSGPASCP